jgi:uncharacterized protein (DUF362 family)
MVAGGPWEGPAEQTNLIIASGDRIAADVVGLALLKHFDKWEGVSKIGVWEQRQIRRAQLLGLGVGEKGAIELVTTLQQGNQREFVSLMDQMMTAIRA